MADSKKQMKKYIYAISRRLNMPQDFRSRVMNDFTSSVQGRREAGQTSEEIIAELGSPRKVAADLNEQMKDYTYVKSPWRWLCLAIIIGSLASITFGGTIGLLTCLLNASISSSVGIIGGADGPTAIFVTASSNYIEYQLGISLLVLVMGILSFYRLSRCARK